MQKIFYLRTGQTDRLTDRQTWRSRSAIYEVQKDLYAFIAQHAQHTTLRVEGIQNVNTKK